MATARILLVSVLAAATAQTACDTDRSCPEAPVRYPPVGAATVASGSLVTGALDQRVVVSSDRQVLEYTFTRNGSTVTARYALTRDPPPPSMPFVIIGRTIPHGDCAAQAGRGPVIDAVEVRRGGAVIGSARAFYASANCGQSLTAKAPEELNGPPDGRGLSLAGDLLGWAVGERLTLASGDTVTVTVLDDAGESFTVYGSSQQSGLGQKLGTLTGTGTVTVP